MKSSQKYKQSNKKYCQYYLVLLTEIQWGHSIDWTQEIQIKTAVLKSN